jgi:arylsulfatase A-like enzyme
VIVAAGAALAAANPPKHEAPAFASKGLTGSPNVVLIAVDTLRADFLQAYNMNARPKTPNVLALSQDAVVFQNAIAQSSWTKASFGTILSGLYPEAHTATGKASALPLEITTMAEVLNAGGYYTRGFSNNPNITSLFNYNQGFVEYTDLKPDLLFGAKASCEKLVGYDILRKVYQVAAGKLFKGRINITDFYQPAEVVTDTGLAWIDGLERPKDAPFFLFLHYMDPHDPYRDPDHPGKGYARVQMANPDPDKYKEAFLRSYSYEIEYMDQHVGRLIDGLRQRGLYDDTLIVFTSDHGEEFHEHGGWWHGLSLYDEQIKVPLMLKLPGNAAKGTYISDLARHVDLAPTLAQFARLAPDAKWQGKPLLTAALESNHGDVTFVHSHLDFEGIQLKSLRGFDKKLILANEGNKRGYAPKELYDLAADPAEQTNLADQEPGAVALFENGIAEMDAYIKEGAAQPQSLSTENLSPAERERMRALGYLSDDTGGN